MELVSIPSWFTSALVTNTEHYEINYHAVSLAPMQVLPGYLFSPLSYL